MSKACLVSDPGIPTLEKALDPTVLRSAFPRSCPRSGGRSETFDSKFSSTTRAVRLKDQLSFLEGCWRSPADLGWPFGDNASRLFDRLNAAALGLGDIDMCAGHGRYTRGQVLLAAGRTVTVDWDTYRVADPSCDVARTLVDLRRLGLKHFTSIDALDGAAQVISEGLYRGRPGGRRDAPGVSEGGDLPGAREA